MIKHWTKFEGKPHGTEKDEARVTLSVKKVIMLNRIAYEALGTPPAVELMFDETLKIIGVKPIDARRPNAFPLKAKKGSQYRLIFASSFCTHFGIRIDRTVKFNNIDMDNEGVMTLEVGKAINVGRGAR